MNLFDRNLKSPDAVGWQNWSGNRTAPNALIHSVSSIATLQECVASANRPIRAVGAGHSFTDIVPTDGTILKLNGMGDVRSVDQNTQRARIAAGARLHDLSPALEAHGLGFKNLGDIDVQSFAGAVSTATHGTGRTLPCLAAEITGMTLVKADGLLLTISDSDADQLLAAQVSLGALGIIVEAEISLRPSYRLNRKSWVAPLDEVLDEAEERWNRHRNFEFFYIPFSGLCICISHDETEAEPTPREPNKDDDGVHAMRHFRDEAGDNLDQRRDTLQSVIGGIANEDVVDTSWKLLANERNVPFNEMEYHLPPDEALTTLRSLIEFIEDFRPDVFFPIEVRRTAGDAAWLSPFNGGERISIAVHADAPDSVEWMYEGAEPMFRAAGGRPHWGKLHSLRSTDLAALYPKFDDFCALRRELDPDGVFVTPYFASLWGAA